MPTPETPPLDDWGPACPTDSEHQSGSNRMHFEGRSLRAHAAIELRVPESGHAGLDAMIRKARRLEVATAAMQGEAAAGNNYTPESVSPRAYRVADALIAASEQEPSE